MVRISRASLAAAASASRRAFMGVEPECASWPWKVMAWRSTPLVPSTRRAADPCVRAPGLARCAVRDRRRRFFVRVCASGKRSISTPQRRRASSRRDAIAIGADAIGGDAECGAGEGGRAEQAAAEARAFFVGPIDQTNRDWRRAVEFGGDAAEDFEAGENVQGAVEPAAIGDGIEMAADEQGLFGFAGERDPVVAGGVVVMFDGQAAQFVMRTSRALSARCRSRRRAARRLSSAVRARSSFSSAIGAFGIEGHEGFAIRCVQKRKRDFSLRRLRSK